MGFSAVVAVVAAVGAQQQHMSQKEARNDQRLALKEQKKSQDEQRAVNQAQAAQERRSQIREERVRRARIMQSSQNTGVADSSGESGAISGLSTQLGTNIGMNLGAGNAARNISRFNQNAADFEMSAQDNLFKASTWGQVSQTATSIFGASGGFSSLFNTTQAPAPVSTATPRDV
jgi:hypothetical protein